MKDFDDFAQLVDRTTDQDMARIFANVIEQMNLPKDANGNVSFSVEDLMPFSTAVSTRARWRFYVNITSGRTPKNASFFSAFCTQAAYRIACAYLA